MKTALLTLAAITLTAGAAFAAPQYRGHDGRGISNRERAAIAQSARNLTQLRQRVYADGRVGFFERIQLNNAERRHSALVQRARRS